MRIVVLDGYGMNPGDMSWEPLAKLGELEVYDRTSADELMERARGAEALLTNKTVLSGDTLRSLPDLKYVGVLATGYNVVDVDVARELGIVVTNIPAYSTDSVAQMVFSHLLAIVTRVEHYTDENRKDRWSDSPDFVYWDTPLHELTGKTFGIVGLGNIGKSVARIAQAFGMKVQAYTSKSPEELPDGVEKVGLDELFQTSDVLSLHCPLTDDTRHIVNEATLKLMKPTAILINTGRGPLVDEDALAQVLNSGCIYAAGLDVLSCEPPRHDNPLLSARNCYITPHLGWATVEARERLMQIAAENLEAFISGHPRNNVAG